MMMWCKEVQRISLVGFVFIGYIDLCVVYIVRILHSEVYTVSSGLVHIYDMCEVLYTTRAVDG
jgi:hypothetical protein